MCEMFSNDVFIVTFEAEFDLVNAGWVCREKIVFVFLWFYWRKQILVYKKKKITNLVKNYITKFFSKFKSLESLVTLHKDVTRSYKILKTG